MNRKVWIRYMSLGVVIAGFTLSLRAGLSGQWFLAAGYICATVYLVVIIATLN